MASRKLMKGILRGFLGTYTSRYSEFDRYWLFGFIVAALGEWTIDLLDCPVASVVPDPADTVRGLAANKFRDQMSKAGLQFEAVRSATLSIQRGEPRRCSLYMVGYPGIQESRTVEVSGFDVTFSAQAVMDSGRVYEACERVFVAPQDPSLFTRSGRPGECFSDRYSPVAVGSSAPNKRFNLTRRIWRIMIGERRAG
jgi:hypothetical protein